jgi:hypothetical protein
MTTTMMIISATMPAMMAMNTGNAICTPARPCQAAPGNWLQPVASSTHPSAVVRLKIHIDVVISLHRVLDSLRHHGRQWTARPGAIAIAPGLSTVTRIQILFLSTVSRITPPD